MYRPRSLHLANRVRRYKKKKTCTPVTGSTYALTDGSVVDVQRLGRHELANQRSLAHAGRAQHGDAERLRDARTAGAARLSGRRQRRAGAGPRRPGIGAAPAANPDHGVVRGGQVLGAENQGENDPLTTAMITLSPRRRTRGSGACDPDEGKDAQLDN